jgi:preprotein translocase subunit SecD
MRLLLGIFALALTTFGLHAGSSRPQITFRVHVERGQSAGSSAQVMQIALTQPEQVITVGRYAELSETQVQSVLPTPDGGLMVLFNSTGTKILESATANNQGRVLVVFLNGRVVYAPLIDMPLRTGRILVPGPLDPAEVAALQQFLQKRDKKS